MVAEQRQETRGLREELVAERRRPYADVTRPESRTTLVVGNSLLNGVTFPKNVDGNSTEVRTKSGATFDDIGILIDGVGDKEPQEIAIVGGSREAMDKVPTAKLKADIKTLIVKANTVSPSVTVSSVLPILKRHDPEQLADINDAIRATCDETSVKFVDNEVNFTFRNGDVDAAAFRKDGLHLSDSGVDRLLSNLGLPERAKIEQKQRRQPQQQQRRHPRQQSSEQPTDNAGARDETDSWRVVSRRRSDCHTTGQCAKCGESNHVSARCNHRDKVRCRQCGDFGHKEKHHTWNKGFGHHERPLELNGIFL